LPTTFTEVVLGTHFNMLKFVKTKAHLLYIPYGVTVIQNDNNF